MSGAFLFRPTGPLRTGRRRGRTAEVTRRRAIYTVCSLSKGTSTGGDAGEEVRADNIRGLLGNLPQDITSNAAVDALCRQGLVDDALSLLDRMTRSNVLLADRTYAMLIDAALNGDKPIDHLAQIFDAASRNGFATAYRSTSTRSSLQALPPQSPNSDLPPLPDTHRARDVLAALLFLFLSVTGVTLEVVDPIIHESPLLPTLLLLVVGGWLAVDRYYGEGLLYGTVEGGLRRLLADDPTRECRVDAAAYLAAYLLGIPYVCFRPNATEALKRHADVRQSFVAVHGERVEDYSLIERYLVWVMAAAAAELDIDGRLIEADTSRVRSILAQASQRKLVDAQAAGRVDVATRWALAEARELLGEHRAVHVELTRIMVEGATAGECALCIEKALSEAPTTA